MTFRRIANPPIANPSQVFDWHPVGETGRLLVCGIAGFLDPGTNRGPELMHRHVIGMTNSLAHRGPDDEGAWVDPIAGVALGNRRLAIIDLSPEGHQPMHSASGRYVITYNGEIYNSAAIARTLESAGLAPRWRGHSDTEVILAAIEAWGLDRALESFNGMFAFALWDVRERTLCLVRDRLGVKPLYYGRLNGALVFGSELQAISAYPGAALTIDRDWLDRYLRDDTPTIRGHDLPWSSRPPPGNACDVRPEPAGAMSACTGRQPTRPRSDTTIASREARPRPSSGWTAC